MWGPYNYVTGKASMQTLTCDFSALMVVWGLTPRKFLRIGPSEIECESDSRSLF